jgi:hypothetical protein
MWYSYFLNIHVIAGIIIFLIILYVWFTSPSKKKSKRNKSNFNDIDLSGVKVKKSKSKPKKKNENRCRDIFEGIFEKEFPSIRPDWLKNPATGENLELDGYCDALKLAFEYDGGQHSKYTPYFHRKGPQEFVYQVKKDNYKTLMCKKKGIKLIRIPSFVPFMDLERYIRSRLKEEGFLK